MDAAARIGSGRLKKIKYRLDNYRHNVSGQNCVWDVNEILLSPRSANALVTVARRNLVSR